MGISSIIVNVGKVREMCRMVRELSPGSTIVVGGHVAAIPGIEQMVDADHIVRGDGIAWMRRYLGEDESAPIRHPEIVSGFGLADVGGESAGDEGHARRRRSFRSVGCPMGCNFCTTSAFFGGKGKYLNFYDSGEELFDVMCEMEGKLEVKSFFMMDENFLLHKRRAHGTAGAHEAAAQGLGAVRVLVGERDPQYTMRELVELGVSWIWMGLESPRSSYAKAEGRGHACADGRVAEPRHQAAGLDDRGAGAPHAGEHRREIEHAVAHDTDFHQFMLYTPVPGTPLYFEMQEAGADAART